MATSQKHLVWYWRDATEDMKVCFAEVEKNGIKCVHIKNMDELKKFLVATQSFKQSTAGRFVTNRHEMAVVQHLRNEKYQNAVMIYTSAAMVPQVKKDFEKVSRVYATASPEQLNSFASMAPIPEELEKTLKIKNEDLEHTKAEAAKQASTVKELQAELESVKKSLTTATHNAEQAQLAQKKAEDEASALRTQKADLQTQLTKTQQALKKEEAERIDAEQLLSGRDDRLNTLEQEINNLKKELKTKDQQLNAANAELETVKKSKKSSVFSVLEDDPDDRGSQDSTPNKAPRAAPATTDSPDMGLNMNYEDRGEEGGPLHEDFSQK